MVYQHKIGKISKLKKRCALLIAACALITQPLHGLVATQAINASSVAPSTNATNKANGWAHATELSKNTNSLELEFVSTRSFASCFEYRADGDMSQKTSDTNPNAEITDGRYPSTCVNNSTATVTVAASQYVEVRMVFGAEKDERFTWERFDVAVPVCTYDFPAQKMWEVRWGRSFDDRKMAQLFDKHSHGGLVALNGESVPDYIADPANWYWLYPTEGNNMDFTYEFADGTIRTVSVTQQMVDGCQIPNIVWGYQPPTPSESASGFVSSPRYIRENSIGANAANQDVVAQVRVPVAATNVRFTVADELVTDDDHSNEVKDNDIFKTSGAPSGSQWWRLQKALPAGEHIVTGEFLLDDIWYPITGSSVVYSIDTPTASYTTPSDSRHHFRPSDNPVRLRVEDQFEQFRRMVVTVDGVQYEVTRDQCDLRQEGNYLLCDVNRSDTWEPLSAGDYTARTSVYTKANNRVDNIVSREFTVDYSAPVVTNFTAPTLVGSKVTVSATATDDNGVDRVRFFIANTNEAGECKNNLPGIIEVLGVAGDDNTYTAELNTPGLNGGYCVLVSARDVASHTSVPQFRAITIDSQRPTVSIDDFTVSNGQLDLTISGTDNISGLLALGVNIYNASNTGAALVSDLGRIKDNINNGTLEDSVTKNGIDISGLSPGIYTIRAVSLDHANNYSTQSLRTFSISDENEANDDESDAQIGDSDEPSINRVIQRAQNQVNSTDEDETDSPFTGITGFDMGGGIIGAITSPVGDDGDVLGTEDDGFRSTFGSGDILGQTATAQDVNNSPLKAFGVLWYWWLVAFAVFASAWWLIAAKRRKQNDDVRI